MSTDTAYISRDPEVLAAYAAWKQAALAIRAKRRALMEVLGREVWINGHGYHSYVTGFGRLDGDKDGDRIEIPRSDGSTISLIVSKKRGQARRSQRS
jgi:hypothetical protein